MRHLYLGQQWCHDCHTSCTRLDLVGLCLHCDELVAISDPTGQYRQLLSVPSWTPIVRSPKLPASASQNRGRQTPSSSPVRCAPGSVSVPK
ncbi:hypothetical protein C8E87_1626 [Paractinoplanes brasiliensis]|uniref:Uncharacterized protein n=1 Tax=Paractinoplanes brasiliensis TaxID=52695 RepID=A0A4R6JTF4_9ACTN|nr:hypothetical protein C8E87_1626 [Actinoplanes brasiliensis]